VSSVELLLAMSGMVMTFQVINALKIQSFNSNEFCNLLKTPNNQSVFNLLISLVGV